jgi:hypothetical protein
MSLFYVHLMTLNNRYTLREGRDFNTYRYTLREGRDFNTYRYIPWLSRK